MANPGIESSYQVSMKVDSIINPPLIRSTIIFLFIIIVGGTTDWI